MNLKTDKKKEITVENQVEKSEECKLQRKRDFTRSIESLNRLLDKKNQANNRTINIRYEKTTSMN